MLYMLMTPHFTVHLTLIATRNEVGVSLDSDLENVLKWGHDWLVTFNTKKSKLLSMSRSRNRSFPSVHMGSSTLTESSELQLLGLDVSHLRWAKYISGVAKSASKWVHSLSSPEVFASWCFYLFLYYNLQKTTILLSHIWAGAPACHLSLVDRLQKCIVERDSTLEPLSHRWSVAAVGLFYRYFHGTCSAGLSDFVPPVRVDTRHCLPSLHTHVLHYSWSKVPNERLCRSFLSLMLSRFGIHNL